jgi:HSP20 family protein
MAMIRFPTFGDDPSLFQEMARIRSEMDKLITDFTGWTPLNGRFRAFPALNVTDEDDCIVVHAEIPGVRAEDIEVSIEGLTLNLRGERKREDLGDVSYHRRERVAGKFQKSLTLPVEINPNEVEAKCEHGVLKLTLPKAEHARPRKIQVHMN